MISQYLLSHSSIMQKTVSSCPPRPMLAEITNNIKVNSNSVQKNSSDLLMQAKSYLAEDVYMPTENQAQSLNSDATDNAGAESSLVPSDNVDANRNRHSVSNEKKKLKANPYQVLLGYVLEMKADMKEMKTTTNEIKQEVQNFKTLLNKNVTVTKEYIGTIKQICDKFNYKIPFQTVQEFQAFDADLKK